MNSLQSYLPAKPTKDKIRELSDSTGMGLAWSKSLLDCTYKTEMKDGLQCALSDYKDCPTEHGESFLAEITTEMLTLI